MKSIISIVLLLLISCGVHRKNEKIKDYTHTITLYTNDSTYVYEDCEYFVSSEVGTIRIDHNGETIVSNCFYKIQIKNRRTK